MRLIVTRPAAQAAAWVASLQGLGCQAQALPLIDIVPVPDAAPLQAAWQALGQYGLVMFVSANAVEQFFAAAPGGMAWPVGVRAGSTGPGTSAALRRAGVRESDLVEPSPDAPSYDSEGLWARVSHEPWDGRRVLVVRGEDGRDWLADTLRSQGADVDFVAAYRRQAPAWAAAERAVVQQALAAPADHLWVFSSSEAVRHLQGAMPQADWSRSMAVATHARIAEAARSLGFGQVRLVAPDVQALASLAAAGPSIQFEP